MAAEPEAPAGGGRLGRAGRVAAVVALGLFVALLVYGLVAKAPRTDIDDSLAQGKATAAPDFRLRVLERGALGPQLSPRVVPALGDGSVALDELRGTPLVVNFWASWCPPCQAEAGLLERGWRAGRGRGVLFVGLNMQDLTGDARDFVREFDNTYLNLRDQSNGVARRWGVTGLPETFFVTARGQVVGHVVGAISEQQLREGTAAALSGRPLGALEGGDRRAVR